MKSKAGKSTSPRSKTVYNFSASAIKLYQECRYRYYDRYIRKIPETRRDISGIWGSALHFAIEQKLNRKSKRHAVHPIQSYRRYFHSVLNYWMGRCEVSWSSSAATLLPLGDTILDTFPWQDYESSYNVTEFPFDLVIWSDDTREYRMRGYIDLYNPIYKDGKSLIVDWKSSKRMPSQKAVNEDIQFHIYAWVMSKIESEASFFDGAPERNLQIVRHHLRTHEVQFSDTTKTAGVINGLIHTMHTIANDTFSDITPEHKCSQCPMWCQR